MTDYVTFTYLVPDDRSDTRTVTVAAAHFTDWPSTVAYFEEGEGMRGILKSDIVGEVVRWSR